MRARALLNHMILLGLMPVALVAIAAPVVVAQTPSEEADRRAAEDHFERGVELFHEGNPDAALVEMERAYELYRSHKLLFNLAQEQEERHAYVTALGLYRKYLDEGGSDVGRERRRDVEARIRVLGTRVAHLWVSSNVDGAEVFVDDAAVATLPLEEPILVNAGVRRIRVSKPGYRAARQQSRARHDQDRQHNHRRELRHDEASTPKHFARSLPPLGKIPISRKTEMLNWE